MKFRYMIGPLAVFAVVFTLLVVARFYDQLPVQAPPCQMKARTGIPCLACRGTRSFQAIAKGQLMEAVRLNPAAVLGAILSITWLAGYLLRKGSPPTKTLGTRSIVWAVFLILFGNWLYLIITRQWYP